MKQINGGRSMYECIYSFFLLKDIYGNLNVPGAMLERSLFIRPRETKAQEWDANSIFRTQVQYQGQKSSKCCSVLTPESMSYHLESVHSHTNIDVAPIIR